MIVLTNISVQRKILQQTNHISECNHADLVSETDFQQYSLTFKIKLDSPKTKQRITLKVTSSNMIPHIMCSKTPNLMWKNE